MCKCIVGVVTTPGKRLKAWRKKQGLSQAGLAELVDVKQSTISRIESGECDPELHLAIRLSKLASERQSRLPVDMWLSAASGI
jgi:DNA-binding XRE family transcriptional regulator